MGLGIQPPQFRVTVD